MTARKLSKGQIVLIVLVALSIVACFLPWLTARVEVAYQDTPTTVMTTTISGYEYIAPLGAKYTAPVAILSVIGFVLIAYSFKDTKRERMLIALGGTLILAGAIAAFGYTSATVTSAAMADYTGYLSLLVRVDGQYGMGLEVLFGILIIIIAWRWESSRAGKGAYLALTFKED